MLVLRCHLEIYPVSSWRFDPGARGEVMNIDTTFGSLMIQMTFRALSWISLLNQGPQFSSGFLTHFLAVTAANTSKGFVLAS